MGNGGLCHVVVPKENQQLKLPEVKLKILGGYFTLRFAILKKSRLRYRQAGVKAGLSRQKVQAGRWLRQ